MNKKAVLGTLFVVITVLAMLTYQRALRQSREVTPNSDANLNQPEDLDSSVCNPKNGDFSIDITNPYFPLTVGLVNILEDQTFKVQFSVLNETKEVAGITARVVEEREWENGNLIEVSQNYFVQAPEGTVCYFGEDVDEYEDGEIVGHAGSWLAGVGQNIPGIIMPADPKEGQTYQIEYAPSVAMDKARHVSIEQSYTTPAGTFENVLLVEETPKSTKRYALDVGLIYDDGAVLIKY